MRLRDILKKIKPNAKITETANMLLYEVEQSEIVALCGVLKSEFHLFLKTIKATDERSEGNGFKIFYVFGNKGETIFLSLVIHVDEKELTFPTLSLILHEAAYYELEIYTFFGLTPLNHPRLSRFILHENISDHVYPLRKDFPWNKKLPLLDTPPHEFQRVHGEGIYELPVGPVHAGIIEPGHFRFSLAGEEVISLEPKLGFVHKGTEKLFETLALADTVTLSESVSGDTSFTHSLAYCQAIESLSDMQVPKRGKSLRVIFSELERLANHVNDIGFMLNDTAFAFGGSFGQRMKEIVMRLSESLTGSRFLRGVNIVGGVTKDISIEQKEQITKMLTALQKDFDECIELIEDNETVLNRLKKTGLLHKKVAEDHGVVGVGARAVGIAVDARIDHPYAAYDTVSVQIAVEESGDVYGRFRVRVREVLESIRIIIDMLAQLPHGEIVDTRKVVLTTSSYAVGIAEGWRGDIVYFVSTDKKGIITRVGIRDASFLNWPAVPYAVVGNIVPDFPLINKSFNLSYSGFDR